MQRAVHLSYCQLPCNERPFLLPRGVQRNIAVTPLAAVADELRSRATIRVTASVVASATPPAVPILPALTVRSAASTPVALAPTWRLVASSPWADLTRAAAAAGSLRLEGGVSVTVKGVSGTDDGRVLVEVAIGGQLGDLARVEAVARYDAAVDEVVLDELRPAAGTPPLVAKLLDGALAPLRARLRWKVEPRVKELIQRLDQMRIVKGTDTSKAGRTVHSITASKAGLAVEVAFPGSLSVPTP